MSKNEHDEATLFVSLYAFAPVLDLYFARPQSLIFTCPNFIYLSSFQVFLLGISITKMQNLQDVCMLVRLFLPHIPTISVFFGSFLVINIKTS